MAIPDYQSFMLPLLNIAADEKQHTIKEAVQRLSDHFNLNELPAFEEINPTSENIARFIYWELSRRLNSGDVKISKVKVCETPGAGAFYWEE